MLSFRKWVKGIDTYPEDETSYTTQFQEAFLQYVDIEYYIKPQCLPVNELNCIPMDNIFCSEIVSRSGQYSYDPYDVSSDDDKYLMPKDVAEMTPRWSDHIVCLLTAARLYVNSLPELPQNWGQTNPNLNEYHSGSMEISSTFSIPDITDWCCQQGEMSWEQANFCDVVCDIFAFTPHGVAVEAIISLEQDVFGCRQSKATGETLRKIVVVQLFF